NQIVLLQAELDLAVRRRDSLSVDGNEQRQVKKLRDEIDYCKKELRKKEQHMRHSKTHRLSVKSKIELVCESLSVTNLLMARSASGRPRLEEQQPELLKTIVDITMFGASAEERRRFEIDDKARVPIGLTAANKQAPLPMRVEYRVLLSDHDWVIASKHKLIPSVYAGCIIKANDMGRAEAVTYSGPIYVAVRSDRHSSSTASSHAKDAYGGPDENPRYAKVISHALHHFVEHDLDTIFIFTNAPGKSAFNRVERRMAALCQQLSGFILPHYSYGTHLDEPGRTTDFDLEKKNFEVWNSMVIDHHEVVKCDDRTCCGNMQSFLRLVLPERFLPSPYSILQSSCGLYIPKPEDHDRKTFASFLLQRSFGITSTHEGFEKMPYDLYCPSLKDERHQLVGRTCKQCGLYFCTKKNAQTHRWSLHYRKEQSKEQGDDSAAPNIRPIRIVTRRSLARSLNLGRFYAWCAKMITSSG
ncbi:hypothetical protein ILUMI_11727, partial [Ignelater luminosus]